MSRRSYLHSDPKFRIPLGNNWGKLRLFMQSILSFFQNTDLQNLSLEKSCLAIRSINFEIVVKISMLANAYVDEKKMKITKILCICNYLIGLCYGKKWLQFCFWYSEIAEYRNGIIDFGSQCLVVFLAKQFP